MPHAALSESSDYVRYEDGLPRTPSGGTPTALRRTHQTPPGPPRGRTAPLSRHALARELAELGVVPGEILLVHAALRATGLDADTLRTALLTVLGEDGTLVVPAFTEENSDSSAAHREQLRGRSRREAAAFRAAMPAFDPATTPCPAMGRFAESVRTAEGAVRSAHPQSSFAALGPRAAELLDRHPLHSHLGPDSPLGALERAGARVLMINVGYAVCTAFHLAEYGESAPLRSYRCVVKAPDGTPRWVEYEDVRLDDRDFEAIGASFPWGLEQSGPLGGAVARLFPIKDAVGHAEEWMSRNRR